MRTWAGAQRGGGAAADQQREVGVHRCRAATAPPLRLLQCLHMKSGRTWTGGQRGGGAGAHRQREVGIPRGSAVSYANTYNL